MPRNRESEIAVKKVDVVIESDGSVWHHDNPFCNYINHKNAKCPCNLDVTECFLQNAPTAKLNKCQYFSDKDTEEQRIVRKKCTDKIEHDVMLCNSSIKNTKRIRTVTENLVSGGLLGCGCLLGAALLVAMLGCGIIIFKWALALFIYAWGM